MVFAYAKDDPLRIEEVFKTPANMYLFWSEFMILRRRAENSKA
jgi:hypothetical protein